MKLLKCDYCGDVVESHASTQWRTVRFTPNEGYDLGSVFHCCYRCTQIVEGNIRRGILDGEKTLTDP